MKKLGVYVHIPFCVRKCAYCDFLSYEGMFDKQGPYIGALNREIDTISEKYGIDFDKEYEISSIYFGGGTPTSIKPEYVCDLLKKIISRFNVDKDIEITLEANPGTVDFESLKKYRKAGFNRLSLGMQSADNAELRYLGRIHTYEEFKDCYEVARESGFTNVNVDIMTALPYQNSDTLQKTLDSLRDLSVMPEHVSAYSLIVEPGTEFYKKFGEMDENGYYTGSEGYALPVGNQERALYYQARNFLKNNGYVQYEISNFAMPSYESVHNSSYWTRQDYIGIGLNASSFVNSIRYRNTADLDKYIEDETLIDEKIMIDEKSAIEEFMFLGLRRMVGVNADEFERVFKRRIRNAYGEQLDDLIFSGLMVEEDGNFKLTDRGIDYGNYCFSRFLFD